MDHSLALACIGYGNLRVLRERDFAIAPFALPSSWIVKERDPVGFCVEAMAVEHPDWAARIDGATRAMIGARLKEEALRERAAG